MAATDDCYRNAYRIGKDKTAWCCGAHRPHNGNRRMKKAAAKAARQIIKREDAMVRA